MHYFERGLEDRQSVLVADVDARVVGFANVGPRRDEDAHDEGEVRAIYVLPEHWGRGIGRELMIEALAALADHRFRQAMLWVLDTNERARRFYESGGWAPDGATRCDERLGFPISEVRYRRQLD